MLMRKLRHGVHFTVSVLIRQQITTLAPHTSELAEERNCLIELAVHLMPRI